MYVAGLGEMDRDDDLEWYLSAPVAPGVLGGHRAAFVFEGYDDDPCPGDFHDAVARFLALPPQVLHEAGPAIFRYYQDCRRYLEPDDDGFVEIAQADGVWPHIRFGGEIHVARALHGDRRVYVSLECACSWEREHGLQIVLRDGERVNKVGPYDGRLSHGDDGGPEDAYRPRRAERTA